MRAMVLDQVAPVEQDPLVLRELPTPEPGPGEVRIRITCCAVCRTDLHIVEGDLPEVEACLPIVPGHQAVGVVDALGEGCRALKVGQRVGTAWLRWTDGTCLYCRRGRENLCEASRYNGLHAHGGYAEYTAAPEDFVYALPEGMDDVAVSPLLCAGIIGYRSLERVNVPENGRLLLVGFGSSAHIIIQIARHRGHEVAVATRSPSHQRMARQLGATWVGENVADLPELVDSAILFAPSGKLVPPILAKLRRGGMLSCAGIHMSPIPEMDYDRYLYQERDLRNATVNTREDGRRLLEEAAAAGVETRTTEYDLADANRALRDMKASRIDGTGVLGVG